MADRTHVILIVEALCSYELSQGKRGGEADRRRVLTGGGGRRWAGSGRNRSPGGSASGHGSALVVRSRWE
jgi:hypothetical protein